ncbi:MAG: hypothetical protein KC503_42465, partial [Myxococcales bacterium]|nr:hypothetical protein [Myxococcales bacterium]
LLEAWRVAPAAELAQLVEAVSQRITARLPPIRGASRAATHQAWLAVAARADPCDLPRLLRSITDTKGRSTDALARLQALAGWPADPRAANGVLAQLAVPAFHSSSSRPFWSALIDWAVAHGDPRAADAFEALGARYDVILATRYADRSATASWFRRQLHSAAARLRELAAVTLSKADQRTIERLAKRLGDGDAPYLERIYADLESDEPRQAFADHLLERGDPRGELIALQLSGGDRERAAALVGDHAHAWVGGLAPFLNLEHCRFERGFVDHVEIAGFEPQSLGPVLHDPVWATVRTIHLVAVEPSRFTASAAMRALEKVTINARRGRRAIRIVAG